VTFLNLGVALLQCPCPVPCALCLSAGVVKSVVVIKGKSMGEEKDFLFLWFKGLRA
jgi:hypothetical protein